MEYLVGYKTAKPRFAGAKRDLAVENKDEKFADGKLSKSINF